ncbi:MAG: YafY family transcriptional regulator [Chloroflexi bacterium]|nr:YafY family transcriptional regulator [Chloroflexota bacterium]
MSHPATRVLTVLELLQSRPRLSGTELAERLDVDPRTVRRYISALQDLGVPVESESGRYGGYRLRPGYKLPPMMFNEEEALAVILGLLASRRAGLLDAAPAVEGALAKIDRVLPDRLRGRVQAVQGTLAFTPLRGGSAASNPGVLLEIGAAAQESRRVWLRYRGAEDVTERTIDPYGVVVHRGRWYAVGWCHLRRDVRLFRLDRIQAIEPRDESFSKPLDFDCVDYVLESLATFAWGWPVEVELELSLDEARRRIVPDMGTLEATRGGVVLRTQVEGLDFMARFLVQVDCGFRVVHPPELRDAVRQLAGQLRRYARRGEHGRGRWRGGDPQRRMT